MDIRVFLAVITVVMAASFTLGVAIGPAKSAPQISELVHSVVNEVTGGAMTIQAGDHEPAGQHLLVDIKGIEADFLDSEARLSKAMVDTVQDAGLTMLSYHCHALVPKGVSCVGVLLESHISFHTWPDEGVITLDLFTCGEKPLIPVVKTIKRLFGIGENIQIQWSHELRGFRRSGARGTDSSFALLDHNSDLSQLVWSPFDCTVKDQVVSILTKHQRVDIWDLVGLDGTPSHHDAMKHNLQPGDPRWLNNEVVTPDRYLFLDGVLQSDNDSRHEYHEAIVHPVMFTHSNPKNVAIVGGAEGATLLEVLKHKTIESVTMIEIDGELIDIVREYMPSMSNCSDLVGRAENCFDDDLTNLILGDAKQWFLDRYGPNPTEEAPKDLFDVVIIDAIEPEVSSGLSKELYINESVLSAIIKSMGDDVCLLSKLVEPPIFLTLDRILVSTRIVKSCSRFWKVFQKLRPFLCTKILTVVSLNPVPSWSPARTNDAANNGMQLLMLLTSRFTTGSYAQSPRNVRWSTSMV
jgi:spermidine synthase